LGLFEEVVGDFASGRVFGGILAFDFHLEDFVGAFVGVDCPATIKNGFRRQLEMTPDDN
jgi:hypothetical protein